MESSSDENDSATELQLPAKRRTTEDSSFRKKFRGAAIYKSKFQSSWPKTWPFVQPVKNDPHAFFCNVCRKSVSCKHQGERDVVRHAACTQHQRNKKALQSTSQLNFASTVDPVKDKVITVH